MIIGLPNRLEPYQSVYFREQGTLAPANLFYDQELTIAAPCPIVADIDGRLPMLFSSGVAVFSDIRGLV